LKEKPQASDAQFEAARIYTDWGLTGGATAADKWLLAVLGDRGAKIPEKQRLIWGWQELSNRIARNYKVRPKEFQTAPSWRARYNLVLGKYHYALEQPKQDMKEKFLQQARLEVLGVPVS